MPARPEKPIPGQTNVGEHSLETTLELIGDPKKVAQELQEFRDRMKREKYDPHPDKLLILGRQARIKRAA